MSPESSQGKKQSCRAQAALHPLLPRDSLIGRDGLSTEEAEARIRRQWPLERKTALADVVIDNSQGLDQLGAAVVSAL